MKIRMTEHRSGGRYDGRPWPPVGEDFDVPDEEGAGLCAQGSAIPVVTRDADVEERAEGDSEPPAAGKARKGAGARQRAARNRPAASQG